MPDLMHPSVWAMSEAAVIKPPIAPGSATVDLTRLVSTQLKADVRGALAEHVSVIVVDLRRVNYVESYALGALVSIARDCREQAVTFCLLGLDEDLRRLFSQTRLDTLMYVVTAEEWAAAGGDA